MRACGVHVSVCGERIYLLTPPVFSKDTAEAISIVIPPSGEIYFSVESFLNDLVKRKTNDARIHKSRARTSKRTHTHNIMVKYSAVSIPIFEIVLYLSVRLVENVGLIKSVASCQHWVLV